MICATDTYAYFEKGNFFTTEKLDSQTKHFMDQLSLSPTCLILVNERKILLQKVYKNIIEQVSKKVSVQVQFIDNLKPGSFTNYMSSYYTEPKSVLLLLTKNHNKKEKRIIAQLLKMNIKINLITLGLDYYNPKINLIRTQKIKALYFFLIPKIIPNTN